MYNPRVIDQGKGAKVMLCWKILEYGNSHQMELEHGVQELQRCRLDNPCTHYREIPLSSLPDYIIDHFMRSLQVQESPRHSR